MSNKRAGMPAPTLEAGPVQDAAANDSKRQCRESDKELRQFFRSWAWKREHRPDKDRFQRPYKHPLTLDGEPTTLTIHQRKFAAEGFASTVWDSAIVVAKYLETHPQLVAGRKCLDLSAGCGLVGVTMAKLGGKVTVTDLAPNLPLLQQNCAANGLPDVAVKEHRWGEDVADLGPPFDVVVACDVMYVSEVVPQLVTSLAALCSQGTTVLVAHGRNRPAEPEFTAAAQQHFSIELVPSSELDPVYQCTDVDVLRLRLQDRPPTCPAAVVKDPGQQ